LGFFSVGALRGLLSNNLVALKGSCPNCGEQVSFSSIIINYHSAYHLSIIIWQSEKLEHVSARYLHLLRQTNPFEHLIEQNAMSVNAHWSTALKLRYAKDWSISYHFAVVILSCVHLKLWE
jgi:hypothetical protein